MATSPAPTLRTEDGSNMCIGVRAGVVRLMVQGLKLINLLDWLCVVQELFPGSYLPTPTHHFLRLLHDKGLLLRVFTQNIDGLEQLAGLPQESVVPAHGSFDSE